MQEVMLKTHLIITNIEDQYSIKWFGSIKNSKPIFENDLPVFVIIGSNNRVELNTINMKRIEECAKRLTHPRGKEAITSDIAYIYIKEENNHEKLIGKVIHTRIKTFKPVYDAFKKI